MPRNSGQRRRKTRFANPFSTSASPQHLLRLKLLLRNRRLRFRTRQLSALSLLGISYSVLATRPLLDIGTNQPLPYLSLTDRPVGSNPQGLSSPRLWKEVF